MYPIMKNSAKGEPRILPADKQRLLLLPLHEAQCRLRGHAADGAGLVRKRDAVALVGHVDDLGSESCADELRSCFLRDGFEQTGDGCPVLSVEVGVHLVEDHHRARIGLLDGEDETQGTQTWRRVEERSVSR